VKPFFLLSIFCTFFCHVIAQNIGIGTQNPHASAQLDVSSTTRGLLAPRMTTTQRNAIESPAKGLLVYDTQINSLFHYNGSTWVNLAGSGGEAFSLPYSAVVNLNTNAFRITNDGLGDALSGVSSYEFGRAVTGFATGEYGYGFYGYVNQFNAIAMFAEAPVGTAIRARATAGLGLDVSTTNLSAIKATIPNVNANQPVIQAQHEGLAPAINALSKGGYGIVGLSQGGSLPTLAGVYGQNTHISTGVGVLGEANGSSAFGVRGESAAGTALFGISANGYGLQSNGKLRLYGGTTNPSPGAVLTSTDGLGNAVWKPKQIAFKAYGTYASFIGVTMSSASRKMHFASEQYDYGNNFTITNTGSPSSTMSTFLVPVGGLYHFDVGIKLTLDDTFDDFRAVNVFVILNRNNTDQTLLTLSTQCCNANLGYEVSLNGSIDHNLQTGDRVRVQIYQWNDDDATAKLTNDLRTFFSGHLVFAH
jgi:hypothetical protein